MIVLRDLETASSVELLALRAALVDIGELVLAAIVGRALVAEIATRRRGYVELVVELGD